MAEDRRSPGVCGVGLSVGFGADGLDDLGPALDRFAALGLDSVEIFLPSLGVVAGARVRAGALARLRRICADRPFALTLHGPLGGNLGEPEHRQVQTDAARACLEVGAEIGATALVQHAAVLRGDGPDARARDCEIAALRALAPEAATAGVVLCVETMFARPGEWTAAPHELAETLAAVDSPWVGATLDFGHALLNATRRGIDFLASMAALAPHARHLHIHDNFGQLAPFRPWSRGDAILFGFGDLHLPPGAGAAPWGALAALPYGGPAVANLELDARWRGEWPEAITWVREWIAQTMASPAAHKARAAAR